MEGHRIWGVDRGSGHKSLRWPVKKMDVGVYGFRYSTFVGAEQFQEFMATQYLGRLYISFFCNYHNANIDPSILLLFYGIHIFH